MNAQIFREVEVGNNNFATRNFADTNFADTKLFIPWAKWKIMTEGERVVPVFFCRKLLSSLCGGDFIFFGEN